MSQAGDHDATPQPASLTHNAPEQPLRRTPLTRILTWGAGILLAGAVLIVAWQILATQGIVGSSPGNSGGRQGGSPVVGTGGTKTTQPDATYPDLYWQTIRVQVAAGFHLTVDQLKVKLTTPTGTVAKGPTTPDISEVAAQQGIDATQLRTIEVHALQQAGAALVSQHLWTQQQADQQLQTVSNEPASKLNALITSAFVAH